MYRSKFEAYTFLSDIPDDLRCDFEILTDEISSMTGVLRSVVEDEDLQDDLLFVAELVYHINPSLRTKVTVTPEELSRLHKLVEKLESQAGDTQKQFLLPVGNHAASLSHVLRARLKMVVRLLYRHNHQGNAVDDILYDFTNLLSGYFFLLAIKLNNLGGVAEIPFKSRNYKM